jgi:hypothetical protein
MSGRDEQTTEDVLAAAVVAQLRQYERETGNQREVLLNQLDDESRIASEAAQDHHAARMRDH